MAEGGGSGTLTRLVTSPRCQQRPFPNALTGIHFDVRFYGALEFRFYEEEADMEDDQKASEQSIYHQQDALGEPKRASEMLTSS